jgi:hypothetical protein
MDTITITETGCYLDNHRGHYITRDAIRLAVDHGFIIGPFEKFAIDMYEDHDGDQEFPFEAMVELCDEAIAWLNSGQTECDNCEGGINPRDGDYWTHKDDEAKVPRCKKCTGTGRGDRIQHQNFPPIIPENTSWGWNDGDFGLYENEEED